MAVCVQRNILKDIPTNGLRLQNEPTMPRCLNQQWKTKNAALKTFGNLSSVAYIGPGVLLFWFLDVHTRNNILGQKTANNEDKFSVVT